MMTNTNTDIGTKAVADYNRRIDEKLEAIRAPYYTFASSLIAKAGGISALVAFTAMPTDARERMVAAARAEYRRTRDHRHERRAAEGLCQAMRAWNLGAEADKLAASLGMKF